jgi:cell division protein WhiA
VSEELRAELARIAPQRRCCRLAELSALFHSAGSLHLRGRGEIAAHLDVASSAVARRAFSLLRDLGVQAEIRTYRRRAFERGTRYQLHVAGSPRALEVLREAGVVGRTLAPLERPPRRVVGRSCCRAAYLRGALLGAGSLTRAPSLHLELRTATRAGAEFLASVAAAEGVELRVAERARHALVYAKGLEAVAGLLAVAGASDGALALEEHAVVGAARAAANRLANADHANLVRASRASHAQVQAVRRLADAGSLATLPPPLREIAELRVRYPLLSLRELAERCEPPATKAAAHRRLQRLVRLARS